MTKLKDAKILITHFRVGKTDGVSIEIEAWKEILESEGAKVALCSGPINIGADYVIDYLEQQLNPLLFRIDENAFGGLKDYKTEKDFENDFFKVQNEFKLKFENVIKDFKPTHIMVSNIFSVGEGIPIAGGFAQILKKYQIPTIMIHHDFYWENERYIKPSTTLIIEQLNQYFPPDYNFIKHMCINSIGKKSLKIKKNYDAKILYDTFDYNQNEWQKSSKITSFLKINRVDADNDLIVLQATRVVRRKNIELAIDFVKKLQAEMRKHNEIKLYNGKIFNSNRNKVKLILSGYVERRDKDYLDKLKNYAKDSEVDLVYLGNQIDKEYKLFQIYPYADIITFPSEYEGFGNQLLEAFFAKKPVLIYEYPVYKSDIKSKGFELLTLGDNLTYKSDTGLARVHDNIISTAVLHALSVLTDQEAYQGMVNNNFSIAANSFSYKNTKGIFNTIFSIE